jgi:hypothetical protein
MTILHSKEGERFLSQESLGFWTLFILWYSKLLVNTIFWKLDLLLSLGEVWEILILLDPFERANLNTGQTTSY